MRAACATECGRLQVVSDILQLRREGEISIRMSKDRESDRYTLVQNAAIERHHASGVGLGRACVLKALMLTSYFSRTAPSEQSRCSLPNH